MKNIINTLLYPLRMIWNIFDNEAHNIHNIQNKNPYQLIWYKQGWSQKKIKKNNSKYWEWEIKKNNFVPPNTKKN
jgi:hypothetical protein